MNNSLYGETLGSKFNRENIGLLCFFSILFSAFGVSLLIKTYYDKYPEILLLVLGVIFFLVGIMVCIYLLRLKRITISDFYVEINSLLGKRAKTVLLSEIDSYAEIHTNNKKEDYYTLHIYQGEKKLCSLNSTYYRNYFDLKVTLTHGKIRNIEKEEKVKRVQNYYFAFFLLMGALLFALMVYLSFTRTKTDITPNNISYIKGHVTNIKNGNARKRGGYIDLELKEFPPFNFKIVGEQYRVCAVKTFLKDVQPGDEITIGILKEDYEKKISKIKPMTFLDQYHFYTTIPPYAIENEQWYYLLLDDVVQEKKGQHKIWGEIIFSLFGLFFFGAAVFLFLKNRKSN
jgi:hypothetical protein